MTGPAEEVFTCELCDELLRRLGWPAPAATDRTSQGGGRAILPADGQPGALSLRRDGAEDRGEAQGRAWTSSAWASATPTCPRPPTSSRRCSARWPTRATIATPATGASRSSPRRRLASTSGASASTSTRRRSSSPCWVRRRVWLTSAGPCSTRATWRWCPTRATRSTRAARILVGAEVRYLRLRPENGLPARPGRDQRGEARRAKVLFIGYPNNPTAAVVDEDDFFERVVAFAKKYDIAVVHDNAYSELTYDGYVAPSFLATPGAKDVGVEFFSFSKPFNMTGWRIGFAVGNQRDPGASLAAQDQHGLGHVRRPAAHGPASSSTVPGTSSTRCARSTGAAATSWRRRSARSGWKCPSPRAPSTCGSRCRRATPRPASASTCSSRPAWWSRPGTGTVPAGEGFVRLSLTTPDDRIAEAVERIERSLTPLAWSVAVRSSLLHPRGAAAPAGPSRATPEPTCFSVEEVVIPAGERRDVGTGIALAIPPGFAGFVQPRSGLAFKHGIMVVNSPGLIDAGYRGEVRVSLYNSGDEPFAVARGGAHRPAGGPAGGGARVRRHRRSGRHQGAAPGGSGARAPSSIGGQNPLRPRQLLPLQDLERAHGREVRRRVTHELGIVRVRAVRESGVVARRRGVGPAVRGEQGSHRAVDGQHVAAGTPVDDEPVASRRTYSFPCCAITAASTSMSIVASEPAFSRERTWGSRCCSGR